MNKISRRVLLGSLSVGAFALATHIPETINAQNNSGVVNLYSARHYDTDNSIYQSFTQKTGIKINLVEADAAKLIERIKSEGANSPADVILTVDAGNLYRAQAEGILQPVRSLLLNTRIPAYLREPSGYWFGLTKRARVIIYNKAKVTPDKLSTYEDLASPKWKGKIIMRTSTQVYNQSLVASMVATIGAPKTEAWAKGLVANFVRPPEGNDTAQIRAVASGVADLAMVNTYYVARLAKSKKPEDIEVASKIGVFFPNQKDRGTHINISGGGVAKNAPNRAAAIKFLEHLTDFQSQEIFARGNNEYPVLKGVPFEPILGNFGKFKEDEVNASELGKFAREAIQIMDRAGWR